MRRPECGNLQWNGLRRDLHVPCSSMWMDLFVLLSGYVMADNEKEATFANVSEPVILKSLCFCFSHK
jgi:hypothetical protein